MSVAFDPVDWSSVPVTRAHAEYLARYAVRPEVALAAGVYSISAVDDLPEPFRWARERGVPALVFRWREVSGEERLQLKPDRPIEITENGQVVDVAKYVFAKGNAAVFAAVRPDSDASLVLIVEGTKQALAACSYAPEGAAVYAVAGCRMWSSGGIPSTGLHVCADRDVVILLDSDAATNREVYDAGERLGTAVAAEGATSVKFVHLPGSGATGLDDLLGHREPDRRAVYLATLIERARPKPASRRPGPRRRATGEGSERWFDERGGLLVAKFTEALRERAPAALTQEHRVALYRAGAFRHNGAALISLMTEMLGDRYRPSARTATEEFLIGTLYGLGLVLPTYNDAPLVNVANGMLDLPTATLKPHDPVYLSSQQLPVAWEPEARCPTYEAWLDEQAGSQADDLEEVIATMLDPSRVPAKAVFLFGPSKSGKSTVLRLMQAVAGAENTSAVTLHQLAENRFAAANVFGKVLNAAGDLSSAHVEDVSIFKMLTGEDPINADRKYGTQFTFYNRALFAFSANDLPTVSDSSDAYRNRIKPFEFGRSFAGREDPRIEQAMMRELPGILARWVRAWQRLHVRGGYSATDPRVRREFETRSDRVRQWVIEACDVHTSLADGRPILYGAEVPGSYASTGAELARAFNAWAEAQRVGGMGQRKILDRLRTVENVVEVRRMPGRTRAMNVTVRSERAGEWEPDDNLAGSFEDHSGSSEGAAGSSGESPGSFAGSSGRNDVRLLPVPGKLPGSFENATNGAGAEASSSNVDLAGSSGSSNRITPHTKKDARASGFSQDLSRGVGGYVGREVVVCGSCAFEECVCPRGVVQSELPELPALPDPVKPVATRTRAADKSSATLTVEAGKDVETGLFDLPHPEYPRADVATFERPSAVALPEGVLVLDIETGDSDQLWTTGPEFVRLIGHQSGAVVRMATDPAEVVEWIRSARVVIGHNVMGYDLIPFARHYGLDLHALAEEGRVIDTMLAELTARPPIARTDLGQVKKEYSLDSLGMFHFGQSKTGDLGALASEHGGYDRIPLDDERYLAYCAGDVDLTAQLAMRLRNEPGAINEYTRREHRIAAVAAQIRINGFRVDLDVLRERVEAARSRRAELIAALTERYGLPSVKADGKPSKSPHHTKEGRAAIVQAFADLDVVLPMTKKGAPSIGKDALAKVVEETTDPDPRLVELVETVDSLNGVRTVYETVARYRIGDRVHPDITMMQASGRWSITDPGLTVMGKRGGKHHERDVFIPEEGHVIIAADLSQVDARAVAAHCQDHAYLDLFEPGRDSHEEIALAVWGDKSRRDDAKILAHGWNYGMGVASLARKIGSERAAVEFNETMKARFPDLVRWKRFVGEIADAGELLDNGFGRKLRPTPGWGFTQGPALVGQAAARDILMEGVLRLPRELYPYLRAVVHDELVLSVPAADVEEIERLVVEAMSFEWLPATHSRGRPVQISAGLAKRGASWGAVYEK